jgi:sugar phosphate isomerase/epimerase
MKKVPIGIQLYTVRDECVKDFKGTLTELAKMGYSAVEFAWNYGGMEPDELSAFLNSLNLACCGLHAPIEDLLDAGSKSYAYARDLKSPFVTTSLADQVEKDWNAAVENVKKAATVAAKEGFEFTYHNHWQEFKRIASRYALDILYDKTDAATVGAELDTFWIRKGGEEPVPYIRSYGRRVRQIHLKDMAVSGDDYTEIGTGVMDLPAIFAAAEDAHAEWVIYEQDECNHHPIESARISIENMRKVGLVA